MNTLFVLGCLLVAVFGQPTFKITPDCGDNCENVFLQAVNSCPVTGCNIVFEPGQYVFVPGDGKTTLIQGKQFIQISGPGATILVKGRSGFLHLYNCHDITISQLNIDMYRLPFSYGQVVQVTPDSFTMKVDTNQYPFLSGSEWQWIHVVQAIYEYDPNTDCIPPGSVDIYSLDNPFPLTYDEESSTITVQGKFNVKQGLWYVLRHQVYGLNAFSVELSYNIKFYMLNIYSIPGMGIYAIFSKDVVIDSVSIMKKDNRPASICADAKHFLLCTGTFTVINSMFEGQGDDGLNIHGKYVSIDQVLGNKQVKANISPYLPSFAGTDKKILFRNRHNMALLQVNSVANYDSQSQTVTFNDPLPGNLQIYDLIGTASDFASLFSQNNIYRCNRARGNLLKSHNMTINNNTYYHTTGPAIQSYPDGVYWLESGAIQNLTIKNSYFYANNYGIAQMESEIFLSVQIPIWNNGKPTQSGTNLINGQFHNGIVIHNNEFNTLGDEAIAVYATTGLQITQNTIRNAQKPPHNIHLSNSLDVNVSGNTCYVGGVAQQCTVLQDSN